MKEEEEVKIHASASRRVCIRHSPFTSNVHFFILSLFLPHTHVCRRFRRGINRLRKMRRYTNSLMTHRKINSLRFTASLQFLSFASEIQVIALYFVSFVIRPSWYARLKRLAGQKETSTLPGKLSVEERGRQHIASLFAHSHT